MNTLKIGIIREGKTPPDKRVPLTPQECKEILVKYPNVEIFVQPSPIRIFNDAEYKELGIPLVEDISQCDVLIGVKEVPVNMLIPNKTYFFFSHTTKEQPHNQKLMFALLEKRIRMIDWEHLTNALGNRVIAFGRYAGIVGAYNAILTYGKRYDLFHLKPANQCFDMDEMKSEYAKIKLPNIKIALTGGGRVSNGAIEVLDGMNIRKVSVADYLTKNFNEPVYCQLHTEDYNMRKDGSEFNKNEFYSHPELYKSNFLRFAKVTDLLITGAFWDPHAPRLFEISDVNTDDFKINVIADITMDLDGSVPTTQKAASIAEPCYDYIKKTGEITAPYTSDEHITVMAVDNLPCELSRDASRDFGKQFIENVLPNLLGKDEFNMIKNATITQEGQLTQKFSYLEDYAWAK